MHRESYKNIFSQRTISLKESVFIENFEKDRSTQQALESSLASSF